MLSVNDDAVRGKSNIIENVNSSLSITALDKVRLQMQLLLQMGNGMHKVSVSCGVGGDRLLRAQGMKRKVQDGSTEA